MKCIQFHKLTLAFEGFIYLFIIGLIVHTEVTTSENTKNGNFNEVVNVAKGL